MKEKNERKNFIKGVYLKYKKTIKSSIIAIITFCIILIFGTHFLLEETMSDNQFKSCEEVADNLNNQLSQKIGTIEVPEGYSVEMSIIIRPEGEENKGKVVTELQDGKLVMSRDTEAPSQEAVTVILIVFAFIYALGAFAISKAFFK